MADLQALKAELATHREELEATTESLRGVRDPVSDTLRVVLIIFKDQADMMERVLDLLEPKVDGQ